MEYENSRTPRTVSAGVKVGWNAQLVMSGHPSARQWQKESNEWPVEPQVQEELISRRPCGLQKGWPEAG